MGKKITFEFVKIEFSKRNYELLETEYVNAKTKMRYRCPYHPDKELSIHWNNFKTGYGCPYCAGNIKYTFEEVKSEFEKRNYVLLEREYKNNQTPMRYICPEHPEKETKIRFSELLQGAGCPYCAGNVKYDYEYIYNFFKSKGLTLISKNYEGANIPLIYICEIHKKEGEQDITYSSLQQGCGCKYCGIEIVRESRKKYDFAFVKERFEKEGYLLKSKQYIDTIQKLSVVCPNDHTWKINFISFLEGTRCKKCSDLRNAELQKKDIKIVFEAFTLKGFIILDDLENVYKNNVSKIKVLCDNGHESKMTYASISRGSGCKKCSIENNKGENCYLWKGGITPIHNYLRSYIEPWKIDSKVNSGYKCVITGKRFDTIHHLYPFSNIMFETFQETRIGIRVKVSDYSEEELKILVDKCLEIHYRHPLGVCLTNEVHDLFHNLYSKYDNTPDQFEEFKQRYLLGEFNNLISA
jgi:hypothetical protein